MKSRKVKKTPLVFIGIIIIIVIVLIMFIKTINYHNTYKYKLEKIGYNNKEIVLIIKKLDNNTLDYILDLKYNSKIYELINEKYFIKENIRNYLTYIKDNKKSNLSDVVAIINIRANEEWYTKPIDTDLTKKYEILVNKFNKLSKDYEPDDLVNVSSTYSFGSDQKLRYDAFSAFKSMFHDAKEENLKLIINSSYRSYDEQEEVYNEYEEARGEKYADSIAARPGHSEHQTGLAIDIQTYNSTASTFENFEEFKWLQENAYKYGFILRYPKNKEYLTGYAYESWHYRYVGIKIATYIHKNNITYDEYYAYFNK